MRPIQNLLNQEKQHPNIHLKEQTENKHTLEKLEREIYEQFCTHREAIAYETMTGKVLPYTKKHENTYSIYTYIFTYDHTYSLLKMLFQYQSIYLFFSC